MKISIVTPMYNESKVVDLFLERISKELRHTKKEYEIICVNDGSKDNTLLKLKQLKSTYPELRIINLSRNFGKESALTAGIECAIGDVVIPIDADLQDPPELIHKMLAHHETGFDVVLAKRVNRDADSIVKRTTAELFYTFIGKISNIEIPNNVGDYRLMSRRVVDTVKELKETERFMKGILSWPGFSTTSVEFQRPSRAAGETCYNAWSMWSYAVQGITSFSIAPLKLGILLGALVSFISFVYAIFIVAKTIIFGIDVPGYASIAVLLLFLSGMQFMLIGIIGEYVGRIYMEAKNRPAYIIESEY